MGTDLQDLAEEKSAGSHAQRVLWHDAINRLSALMLERQVIMQLMAAASQSQDLLHVTQMLEAEISISGKPIAVIWSECLSMINDSGKDLSAWLKAFAVLGAWLSSNNRKTHVLQAAGYIACSVEAAGTVPHDELNLSAVVHDMLEQYGFES